MVHFLLSPFLIINFPSPSPPGTPNLCSFLSSGGHVCLYCLATFLVSYNCGAPVCMCAKSLQQVWLFVIPWTEAHQAPLSMGFSRQEYWSQLPYPPPPDFPNSGVEPKCLTSICIGRWVLVCIHIIIFLLLLICLVKLKVAHSCLTLCDPMDYTVHGILQARILEWLAFPFFRGSSQPRDWTQVSCIAVGFFTSWTTKETQEYSSG